MNEIKTQGMPVLFDTIKVGKNNWERAQDLNTYKKYSYYKKHKPSPYLNLGEAKKTRITTVVTGQPIST